MAGWGVGVRDEDMAKVGESVFQAEVMGQAKVTVADVACQERTRKGTEDCDDAAGCVEEFAFYPKSKMVPRKGIEQGTDAIIFQS